MSVLSGRRSHRLRPLLLAALVWAPACAGDRETGSSSPDEAPTGGTAVLAVAAGGTTLLPPLAAAALDFELAGALFLGLNVGVWQDGRMVYVEGHPLALATDWTVEGSTLTYRLDPSRSWSDGQTLRAADVVFTYELLADTTLGLPLGSTTERIESVEALDDSTVLFRFDAPYPGMLFDTGVGIIPEHVYGEIPRSEMQGLPGLDAPAADQLVVSGPFRLESWEPADRVVLVRNPASPTPARLDRLVVRVIPDEVTRSAELRAGRVDVGQLNSFRVVRQLQEDSAIRLLRIPQRGYDFVAWNPAAHPAFSSLDVRRALSVALDRAAWIDALDMSGFAEPASGPYGSLFAGLAGDPPGDGGVDEAMRLLEEAGWRDEDGDGVREQDGVRLEFELATTAGNERRESAVQIIQARLAKIGVRAQPRVEEFRALLGRLISRDYEAALMGWQVGLDPDISVFWGDPESPFNVVGFDDPGTTALIDSARAQPVATAAEPYWRRVGERVSAAYPYAFLWFFDFPIVVGPEVRGVEVDVTGFGQGMYLWTRTERAPD